MHVSQGGSLVLDNTLGRNNNDRLPDTEAINLTGGTLKVVGSGSTGETVGPINLSAASATRFPRTARLSR